MKSTLTKSDERICFRCTIFEAMFLKSLVTINDNESFIYIKQVTYIGDFGHIHG